MSTGWEIEHRGHFDDIVQTYDGIRPEYPSELIADLISYAGAGRRALEIGAGTGKATMPFLEAGYDVTAVEIGENMVEFLKARFADCTHFRAVNGAFEDVELPDGSFDLIYAATAFHWVDAKRGCPKAYQLLKPGGSFALFRYTALPGFGDPLYDDIQSVYEQYYHKPYRRPKALAREDFNTPVEIHRGFRFSDMAAYGFEDITMKLYDGSRSFDVDSYLRLLDTFSDHKVLPAADREALYQGVADAINRHGGSLTVDYIFQLYMGRKAM